MTANTQAKRLQEIEARVYHTDGEVGAIKTQITQLSESFRRIEKSMLDKPPVWNTQSVLALMGTLGGLMLLFTGYADIQLEHAKDLTERDHEHARELNSIRDRRLEKIEEWVSDANEDRARVRYELGTLVTENLHSSDMAKHDDEMGHWRDEAINELKEGSAGDNVSIKAIGAWLRDHMHNGQDNDTGETAYE